MDETRAKLCYQIVDDIDRTVSRTIMQVSGWSPMLASESSSAQVFTKRHYEKVSDHGILIALKRIDLL